MWRSQPAPDRAFDRAHDRVDGGSISCATNTSASQYAAALAAIRAAATSGDKAALLAQVSLPLLAIGKDGRRSELERGALAGKGFDEAFPPPMIAVLKQARLSDLTVAPDEGAFLRLGAVWLASGRAGGRPRIVTVNLQALSEANAAARRGAGQSR